MTTVWGVEWADNGYIEDVYTDKDKALADIIYSLYFDHFIISNDRLDCATMEKLTVDLATDVEELINEDYIEDTVYLNSMCLHS